MFKLFILTSSYRFARSRTCIDSGNIYLGWLLNYGELTKLCCNQHSNSCLLELLITSIWSKTHWPAEWLLWEGGLRGSWLQNRGRLCSQAEELPAEAGLSRYNRVLTSCVQTKSGVYGKSMQGCVMGWGCVYLINVTAMKQSVNNCIHRLSQYQRSLTLSLSLNHWSLAPN